LDLASIPDLEDLLIDAFYSGVLSGRLDQKEARLEVMSSLGRDVRATVPCPDPESMEVDLSSSTGGAAPSTESLTASLTAWLSTITNVLSSLDRHLATLAADAVNSVTAQEEHEIAVQIMVAEVESSSKSAKDKEKEGSGSSWRDSVGRLVGGAVGSSSGAVGGSSGKEEMDVDEKDSAGHDSARTPQSPSSGARQRKRGRT
jgi:COP9 signalosome complex subunit 7